MTARISHSLLDPILLPAVPKLYRSLSPPRRLWPEAIVVTGHVIAIGGAIGMAFSTSLWWAGLLASAAVALNHLADMIDGTHARATGQCRNGGELLDHFLDPLSFSYWMIGLSVSAGHVVLGLVAVVILYATALLTSIRAKLTGNFVLSRFGPTEFKAILVAYGAGMALLVSTFAKVVSPALVATVFLSILIAVGVVQLVSHVARSVREVNCSGKPADTTSWRLES